jgi:DNA-binding transcriptional LysR family regulator
MTDWSVREDLETGRLVQLLPQYRVTVDNFNHGIYAVFLPSSSQCKKVRLFVDYLVEHFKRQTFFAKAPQPRIVVNNTNSAVAS